MILVIVGVAIYAVLSIGLFWGLTAIGITMFTDRRKKRIAFAMQFVDTYVWINCAATVVLACINDFRANLCLGVIGAIFYGVFLQCSFKKAQK